MGNTAPYEALPGTGAPKERAGAAAGGLNHRSQRTEITVAETKITSRVMPGLALALSLCMAGAAAPAQTPLRNSFDSAEMQLMAETNLAYTSCLQEYARENVASSPDIRVVAGNATEACEPVLAGLQATLTGNGVNPDFYMGAVTRIKNRAIRRLLPLLMMEQSSPAP